MESADGQSNAKFQACLPIWKFTIQASKLDVEFNIQSIDKRHHLARSHLPKDVLDSMIIFPPTHP